jgi:tetratricopeptide (TPR) repeat protein
MAPTQLGDTQVLLDRAAQLCLAGCAGEARAIYRALIGTESACASAWHGIGLLAVQSGELESASQCFAKAILLEPRTALYQRSLCEVLCRLGRSEEAIACGLAATQLAPKDACAHYHLALAYAASNSRAKALQSYRKTVRIDPNHGLAWNNLGAALEQEGDLRAAKKCYAKAVALNPQHAEAQNNLGAIHVGEGRLDEARASFEAAIAGRDQFVEAHYNLSSLKTYTQGDPHVKALEALWPGRAALASDARIRHAFALGKALEDIGDYDRAFLAYDEGNRMQHQLLPMDEARAEAVLARIIATFDADYFAARRSWKTLEDARTPIFIVGMPRSGTTLFEQILCSHASVFGAGEITDLHEVISAATGTPPLGSDALELDAGQLRAIGSGYLERVGKRAPQSAFITDKMPANFFYLGLIHLALPNAKIIHAMRDPMDSCFSCFARLFNDTMEFAYDQGTLGRYYARYRTLMEHWHRVLPAERILDLSYERLVTHTEEEARRVLEFVGLPWDPSCLEFHRNPRLVRTASVAQVRKPIYTSSLARWKHFAQHLGPLYELVGPYCEADGLADCRLRDGLPGPDPREVIPAGAAPSSNHLEAARSAHASHNEGIEHYKHGRFAQALECYERALQLDPELALALNSMGFLLQELGRLEEALSCFEAAVRTAPELAMARLNLGMLQLKLGDWERGWENYEARWSGSAESQEGVLNRPLCPLPQWNGEAGTSRLRLLVITEQGFGDTFQFSRYLPLVATRFARVGFACSAPTLRLLENTFGDESCFFTRMPTSYEDWDLQCPLLSLPRALGTRLGNVPATLSYLQVPAGARNYWKERLLRVDPGGFRVGIAWAGRKAHQYDRRRSLRLDQIAPLLGDTRITWVSLQKWAPDDLPVAVPEILHWFDWTGELNDFADTAALVANLDLVISIDSAMVHLAGGLGRPVWLLNRFDNEWRWLSARQDSPWYPTLRIFSQATWGDWPSAIEAVRLALAQLPIREAGSRQSLPTRTLSPCASTERSAAECNVEHALERAAKHQSAGRLGEAEAILKQILEAQPRHAHALHLLGVVAYQAGRIELAIDWVAKAVELKGDVALFQSNLAEMYRQMGNVDEAIRRGQRAVELDPNMASAHSNLGIALYDRGQDDAAQTAHLKALAIVPQLVQSLNNLGSIERRRKNLSEAAQWYQKALAAEPDYLESLSNLGAVLVEDENPRLAVVALQRALELRPDYPEALCNLGLARLQMDQAEEARALFGRALQLRRGYPEALVGLAVVRHELGDPLGSVALLDEAIALGSPMANAYLQLGSIRADLGESDAAEAAYQRALALDPKTPDALVGLSNLRMEMGRLEEGRALLHEALALDPEHVGACFQLVQAAPVRRDDVILKTLSAQAEKRDALRLGKRISVHYALGKAYDDLGDYAAAFTHFQEGARCNRSKFEYDAQADEALALRIAAIVNPDFIERLRGGGDPSDTPIFVLGMPRSGTTLTEQIIASHPEVYGAGEVGDLLEIVRGSGGASKPAAFPENLSGLTRETLSSWARHYVARQIERAPNARRVTDKMPANYLVLGLIPLLLPNARIIHVRRDPLDTCLSCFTRLFSRPQPATYSLTELGRHYASYARLMAHWRSLVPGAFLEVQYEDIVADLEGQARRIFDFCGLPWNDACMAFFMTRRPVRTASVFQVRRPLYSSSVGRWRHYEKFLDPLIESLAEFAPAR